RLVELSLFEENQPEVRVEDEDVWVFIDQAAIDDLRLGERVGLEVDQAEEVEDVRVVAAKALRPFQLAPRLGVSPLLERFAATVVVEEKDSLIEWCGRCGGWVALRRVQPAIVSLL